MKFHPLTHLDNTCALLGVLDALRSKLEIGLGAILKSGPGSAWVGRWPRFSVATYFGLSPLFDVDWTDQGVRVYVLFVGDGQQAPVRVSIDGQPVNLALPAPPSAESRLGISCRVWESDQCPSAPSIDVTVDSGVFTRSFNISVSGQQPLSVDVNGLRYITDFFGTFPSPLPDQNPICAIRPQGWWKLAGVELLLEIPGMGRYGSIASIVRTLSEKAVVNLDFASLHTQLDLIDGVFLEKSLRTRERVLDCNINISWEILRGLVNFDPFALRRMNSSNLFFHCVVELVETLNKPERVEAALHLDRHVSLPKAQDDIEPEGLLYAFRNLVQGLIWLKVSPEAVRAMLNPRSQQSSVVRLVRRSIEQEQRALVFEGVENQVIYNTILDLMTQPVCIPQRFLIQWAPEYAPFPLAFLRDGGPVSPIIYI